MESSKTSWYIVKQMSEHCQIVEKAALDGLDEKLLKQWGPFESKGAAIAKRVGLIRAGKCQPS